MIFKDDDVIFSYSRKEAIQDGVLIDVGRMAKALGFRIHVAMTSTVFKQYVSEPETIMGADYGNLGDILHALLDAIKTGNKRQSQLNFQAVLGNSDAEGSVTLKAVCGPDDDGKPCITIMLPEED